MKGYERDPRVTLVQPICSRRVTYKLSPSTLSGELLHKSKDRLCSFSVYIIPGLGTIGKNLTPSALHSHPVSYLWTLMTSFSPSLLQAEQAQLPQFLFIGEMPQSFCHLSGPWTPSSNSISLLYWGPQNWTQHCKSGLTSAEQGRRMASLDLLAELCLMCPRMPLACLASSAHCWFMFTSASSRFLRVFSPKLLPSWVAPSIYWCMGLFPPAARLYTAHC